MSWVFIIIHVLSYDP